MRTNYMWAVICQQFIQALSSSARFFGFVCVRSSGLRGRDLLIHASFICYRKHCALNTAESQREKRSAREGWIMYCDEYFACHRHTHTLALNIKKNNQIECLINHDIFLGAQCVHEYGVWPPRNVNGWVARQWQKEKKKTKKKEKATKRCSAREKSTMTSEVKPMTDGTLKVKTPKSGTHNEMVQLVSNSCPQS